MTFLALSLIDSGVSLSMACAGIGLVFAFFLILAVIKASAGNARMKEISGAIQEGAKAYLNRQVVTISSIAVVIFALLVLLQRSPHSDWFPDWGSLFAFGRIYRNENRGPG